MKSRTVLVALGCATFAVWLILFWLAATILAPQAPTAKPVQPTATVGTPPVATAEPTNTGFGYQLNPDVGEHTPGPRPTSNRRTSDMQYAACAQDIMGDTIDVMDSIAVVASYEDPRFLCEFLPSWQIEVAPLVGRHAVCARPSDPHLMEAHSSLDSALLSLEAEVECLRDFCDGGFDLNSMNRALQHAQDATRFLEAGYAHVQSYVP